MLAGEKKGEEWRQHPEAQEGKKTPSLQKNMDDEQVMGPTDGSNDGLREFMIIADFIHSTDQ